MLSVARRDPLSVTESTIYREEVVGLLFTLNDISSPLRDIGDAMVAEDDGDEEDDDG